MEKDAKNKHTVFTHIPSELLEYARQLRKDQTEPEEILWQILRNRKLNGIKFRRQHPLPNYYILDFYSAEYKLGIELDGGYHFTEDQKEKDELRTISISSYNIKIIRFTNQKVLNNIEDVLKTILENCK